MTSRLHREHDAQVAMLAYRTGLNAAVCKGLDRDANCKIRIEGGLRPTSFIARLQAKCRAGWNLQFTNDLVGLKQGSPMKRAACFIVACAATVAVSACGRDKYDQRSYEAGFADGALATCLQIDPDTHKALVEAHICPPDGYPPAAAREKLLD
jgi:hypothetical protein